MQNRWDIGKVSYLYPCDLGDFSCETGDFGGETGEEPPLMGLGLREKGLQTLAGVGEGFP